MSAGELDPTFGLNGKVLAPFGPPYPTNQIVAVATQPDGKYVAAGEVGARPDFGLARYNADGSLDTTFGVSGFVDSHLIFPAGSGRFSAENFASDVAIQPDGKILEVGSIAIVEPVGGVVANFTLDIGLARFDATGQLDTSFGVNGYVTTQFLNGDIQPRHRPPARWEDRSGWSDHRAQRRQQLRTGPGQIQRGWQPRSFFRHQRDYHHRCPLWFFLRSTPCCRSATRRQDRHRCGDLSRR